jgi:hypothetical protein
MKVARYEVPGGVIVGWVRPAGTIEWSGLALQSAHREHRNRSSLPLPGCRDGSAPGASSQHPDGDGLRGAREIDSRRRVGRSVPDRRDSNERQRTAMNNNERQPVLGVRFIQQVGRSVPDRRDLFRNPRSALRTSAAIRRVCRPAPEERRFAAMTNDKLPG